MKRIAVIGAGLWGQNLIRDFAALGALAAIVDQSRAQLDEMQQQYPDVTLHQQPESAFVDSIDAVAIATPVPTHFELARSALLAGKDVFVEKPLAQTADEARELAAIAARENRLLMVGHLLLYQPAITWIKSFIESGQVGELYGVTHERLGLGRARSVENVLWDSGVHDVAVLLHMVDEAPRRIIASGHRIIQPTVEDDVHVHIDFPSGVRANLHTSWLWPETSRRLVIRGGDGMLVYNELNQEVTLYRRGITPELHNRDDGDEVVYRGHGQPLRLELEHFLSRLQDRQTPLSDANSAVAVLEVLEHASQQLLADS